MSKTFEDVCSKCCRGCNSHEKDRCRDVWNASEQATEKRVLDEVIETIKRYRDVGYKNLIDIIQEEYGVKL